MTGQNSGELDMKGISRDCEMEDAYTPRFIYCESASLPWCITTESVIVQVTIQCSAGHWTFTKVSERSHVNVTMSTDASGIRSPRESIG